MKDIVELLSIILVMGFGMLFAAIWIGILALAICSPLILIVWLIV